MISPLVQRQQLDHASQRGLYKRRARRSFSLDDTLLAAHARQGCPLHCCHVDCVCPVPPLRLPTNLHRPAVAETQSEAVHELKSQHGVGL